MHEESSARSSRRALLAAAAGGAAALAASVALPAGVAAHDSDDLQVGVDNPTTATTSITNATGGSDAFGAAATGTGFGLRGTSDGGVGAFAWSVSAPGWFDASSDGPYTGVFGFSPANADPNLLGVGVWGDSDDVGIYGSGNTGVYGYGAVGVVGQSNGPSAGVLAIASSDADIALEISGKFVSDRAGRARVAKGKSSVTVHLAGVTSSSRILAVCSTNRSGRWVRSASPGKGLFTIRLNAAVSAATYVSWWVVD